MLVKLGCLVLGLGYAAWTMYSRIQRGIPWEDSYQHWLVSAQLASTGSWGHVLGGPAALLPVPHVIYGLVLKYAGLYNLPALELMSLGLVLLSALGLYRWGGLGVALCFLTNPITLLTGGLPVAEPVSLPLLLLGVWATLVGHSWAGLPLALAVLSDRGTWPLVVGLLLLRPQWSLGWPMVAMAGSLMFTRLTATRSWAEVDQLGLDPAARLGQLLTYSIGPLVLPLLLAGLALALWPLLDRDQRTLLTLGLGYLGLVGGLVVTGQLTGSPRYYLAVVPLLLLGSRPVFDYAAGTIAWLGLWLVPVNLYYAEQWPRWVILNQPSVLAGQWLRGHPGGMLYTDSPLVVYASRWPLAQVAGGVAWKQGGSGYLAVVGDLRYRGVYPVLDQLPKTQPLADWQEHWTVGYGAKPVRIYGVTLTGPSNSRRMRTVIIPGKP